MLDNKIAIGEFQVKELINHHLDSLVKVIVDSKKEKEKYNFKNVEIDKSFFTKNIKNNDIHSVAIFKEYKMNFNNREILVINVSNLGEIGTIIRTSISFNIFNIALINNDMDIFDKTIIRTSEGAFFKANIIKFNSVEDIKKKYKNDLIIFNKNNQYPSLDIGYELYKKYLINLNEEKK